MGLDMYLTKHTDVKNWSFRNNQNFEVKVFCNKKPVQHIDFNAIQSVEEEFLTWRKANHIHAWFVKNVQDGEDDCKRYYVSFDRLLDLKDKCKDTIKLLDKCDKIKARELVGIRDGKDYFIDIEVFDVKDEELILKPTSGFFFGSTLIDQYYYDETKRTYLKLKEIEKLKDQESDISFYYQSSW